MGCGVSAGETRTLEVHKESKDSENASNEEKQEPEATPTQEVDDSVIKKERTRQQSSQKITGPSVAGSERSIPNSYLTDEEEETIKDWLKNVESEKALPLDDPVSTPVEGV
eukprot:TRINITY_DN7385_c0_g1_i1.p1 TRINITY_DN7385_c0_g1~~TRINITY_DN7385_c0_g1_i1.p1  ORF type:complete len:111 (+),score=15.53 TRINITY_DN7385_c0_g1_i1:75-407(+)